MEKYGMVLNIHGEVPNDTAADITEHNAEQAFLPMLLKIHKCFPSLRIVLEHCTTSDAVEAVLACGPSVGGTNQSSSTPRCLQAY
jgi:dihydroorotase